MSAGLDNTALITTERYLATLNFFTEQGDEIDSDRSFPAEDIGAYGEKYGMPVLSEEASTLAKQGILYSAYRPGDGSKEFGLRPEHLGDIEIAGELVDKKYDGVVEWFVEEFGETDRMYLAENTELIEMPE